MLEFSHVCRSRHNTIEPGRTQVDCIYIKECIAERVEFLFKPAISQVFGTATKNLVIWFNSIFPEVWVRIVVVAVA